jgi:hypothetical protein
MGMLPIKPLAGCDNQGGFKGQGFFSESEEEFLACAVNHKVRQLALRQIALRRNTIHCGRLVASSSSESLMEIFPDVFGSKTKKKKALFFNANLLPMRQDFSYREKQLPPIGISGNEKNSWMNALLQFAIFVPSIRAMFDYLPPSFSEFMRFIDLYHLDQIKNKMLTSAHSEALVERLLERFPLSFFLRGEEIDLSLVLKRMMEFFLPPMETNKTSNLLAYRPEWQLEVEEKQLLSFSSLDSFLQDQLLCRDELPSELLLSFRWIFEKGFDSLTAFYRAKSYYLFCNALQKTIGYELTAFIEYRKDAFSSQASYITYLKVENSWYQCCNERIIPLRSNHLNIALERGFLFHYRYAQI